MLSISWSEATDPDTYTTNQFRLALEGGLPYPHSLQVMYGLDGRQYLEEITLDHLEADAFWSCFCESTRERSVRATRLHNRVTIATATIHRSNLARSIANSMSAAKSIERSAIRFI
jgi:hypothetical protein